MASNKEAIILVAAFFLLVIMIYSSVSVQPVFAEDPDQCYGYYSKCTGSSCKTGTPHIAPPPYYWTAATECTWYDSQSVQWSQSCTYYSAGSFNGFSEARLLGCNAPQKTGLTYPPPQLSPQPPL